MMPEMREIDLDLPYGRHFRVTPMAGGGYQIAVQNGPGAGGSMYVALSELHFIRALLNALLKDCP